MSAMVAKEERHVQDPNGAKAWHGAPEAPEFPTNLTLVLQLSRDTGPTLRPFAGRLEHLSTGRRARFDSLEAFQAAVMRLLDEAKPK